jgi:hypothetical protein
LASSRTVDFMNFMSSIQTGNLSIGAPCIIAKVSMTI